VQGRREQGARNGSGVRIRFVFKEDSRSAGSKSRGECGGRFFWYIASAEPGFGSSPEGQFSVPASCRGRIPERRRSVKDRPVTSLVFRGQVLRRGTKKGTGRSSPVCRPRVSGTAAEV